MKLPSGLSKLSMSFSMAKLSSLLLNSWNFELSFICKKRRRNLEHVNTGYLRRVLRKRSISPTRALMPFSSWEESYLSG